MQMSEQSGREKLIAVARRIIDGRIGIIEGLRKITGLRFYVSNPEDELFLFIGVWNRRPTACSARSKQSDALEGKEMQIAEQKLSQEIWEQLDTSIGWPDAELVELRLDSTTRFACEGDIVVGMENSQHFPDLSISILALDDQRHQLTLKFLEVEKIGCIYFDQELKPKIEFNRERTFFICIN